RARRGALHLRLRHPLPSWFRGLLAPPCPLLRMHPLPASSLPPSQRPTSIWLMAGKVAGLYAVLGSVWIVVSDLMVAGRPGVALQTAKGLGFVWVTAVLLVLLVRYYLRSVQQ